MVAEVKTGEKAFDQEESRQTFNTRDQGEFLAKKKKKKQSFKKKLNHPQLLQKIQFIQFAPFGFWLLQTSD